MTHKLPPASSQPAAPAAPRRAADTRFPASQAALKQLREQALHCRECPLWRDATQTVFGEGNQGARIVLVGEQPADKEDRAGRPFIGPAGRLLDRALREVGIERTATYVTNAVKHFKFELRGARRIHKKPSELEIKACHQWLHQELQLIHPLLIVVLGATAARAVFGRATAIERNRGRIIAASEAHTAYQADILVTVHPSYLLRVPVADRARAYERFVADLRRLRPYAAAPGPAG